MSILVIASGYFNPLGKHHLRYLEAAKRLGDYLVVIINNDKQVALKGSIPFQDEFERFDIINALECVDCVYRSSDRDKSVARSIEIIIKDFAEGMPDKIVFANGGDAEPHPEEKAVCDRYGIEMKFKIGGIKTGSSSSILDKVGEEWARRNGYWKIIQQLPIQHTDGIVSNYKSDPPVFSPDLIQYDNFKKRSV